MPPLGKDVNMPNLVPSQSSIDLLINRYNEVIYNFYKRFFDFGYFISSVPNRFTPFSRLSYKFWRKAIKPDYLLNFEYTLYPQFAMLSQASREAQPISIDVPALWDKAEEETKWLWRDLKGISEALKNNKTFHSDNSGKGFRDASFMVLFWIESVFLDIWALRGSLLTLVDDSTMDIFNKSIMQNNKLELFFKTRGYGKFWDVLEDKISKDPAFFDTFLWRMSPLLSSLEVRNSLTKTM